MADPLESLRSWETTRLISISPGVEVRALALPACLSWLDLRGRRLLASLLLWIRLRTTKTDASARSPEDKMHVTTEFGSVLRCTYITNQHIHCVCRYIWVGGRYCSTVA